LKKIVLTVFIAMFFIGCGYKPTTNYTTSLLGNKIATNVDIDVKNPTDSIYLKDALNESVVNDYDAKLNDKNSSSNIKLKVNSTSISPIGYDANGYPILYRATANITAYVTDIKHVITTYSASGTYDFATTANSVLDDNTKHNAIKEAFIQALKIIEFKIAAKEMNNDNKSNK
jgi:hypothetical protein